MASFYQEGDLERKLDFFRSIWPDLGRTSDLEVFDGSMKKYLKLKSATPKCVANTVNIFVFCALFQRGDEMLIDKIVHIFVLLIERLS